jgi:anti-repressor protein
MEFSHELALSLVQSIKPFPIDFELGWQWLGYSSKHKAKEKLKRNFEEGIDFEVFTQMGVNSTQSGIKGGRPGEKIFLSIDCFKSLGMMAGTSKGKEVRSYFLKCERIAKQALEVIPAQAQEIERLKLELELAKTQERLLTTTSALATMHGSGMVALILGKPEAVITARPELVV